MEEEYINIGKINIELFKKINSSINTDEVILTRERYQHVLEQHPKDLELYINDLNKIVKCPDYILEDVKNKNTAMVIRHIKDTNVNIILKLAVGEDKVHTKNSIMTFYRIRDKNLKKLQQKHKTIYKNE